MNVMIPIRASFVRNYYNIPGWRTNRHILVIESDDWGAVRMPSLNIYRYLLNNGIRLGQYGYEKFDTIASREDLNKLFKICEKHRDINGNPLVITANCVVANPDFTKIIKDKYEHYYYEPITDTMDRYYPNESIFSLWKEGMERKCFRPQFHGREHVNVPMWMKSLQANVGGARLACEHGVFSILVDKSFDGREKNTASFHSINQEEFKIVLQSINEGLNLFEHLFGYQSKSLIAPSYHWNKEIEITISRYGVKYIQGVHKHSDNGKRTSVFVGQKNNLGQRYLVRNAYFEYSQKPDFDWNAACLKDITAAFRWHKPATISAHRLNFIGTLIPENRDRNLMLFDQLITEIQNRWPDVEFMSSDQLGEIIEEK